MMEKLKFHKKDYKFVTNYLNDNSNSNKETKLAGRVYYNGNNEMIFFQEDRKEYPQSKVNKLYVLLSKNHSELNKLKKELGHLILKK